jgi:hypothetical protein
MFFLRSIDLKDESTTKIVENITSNSTFLLDENFIQQRSIYQFWKFYTQPPLRYASEYNIYQEGERIGEIFNFSPVNAANYSIELLVNDKITNYSLWILFYNDPISFEFNSMFQIEFQQDKIEQLLPSTEWSPTNSYLFNSSKTSYTIRKENKTEQRILIQEVWKQRFPPFLHIFRSECFFHKICQIRLPAAEFIAPSNSKISVRFQLNGRRIWDKLSKELKHLKIEFQEQIVDFNITFLENDLRIFDYSFYWKIPTCPFSIQTLIKKKTKYENHDLGCSLELFPSGKYEYNGFYLSQYGYYSTLDDNCIVLDPVWVSHLQQVVYNRWETINREGLQHQANFPFSIPELATNILKFVHSHHRRLLRLVCVQWNNILSSNPSFQSKLLGVAKFGKCTLQLSSTMVLELTPCE